VVGKLKSYDYLIAPALVSGAFDSVDDRDHEINMGLYSEQLFADMCSCSLGL
jgi:hypothetical protein